MAIFRDGRTLSFDSFFHLVQGGFGATADELSFVLGEHRKDANGLSIGIRHIGTDKIYSTVF